MAAAETIERLRDRTGVSYEDAREALELSDDDVLDALLWLEKNGKTAPPRVGSYTTEADGADVQGGYDGRANANSGRYYNSEKWQKAHGDKNDKRRERSKKSDVNGGGSGSSYVNGGGNYGSGGGNYGGGSGNGSGGGNGYAKGYSDVHGSGSGSGNSSGNSSDGGYADGYSGVRGSGGTGGSGYGSGYGSGNNYGNGYGNGYGNSYGNVYGNGYGNGNGYGDRHSNGFGRGGGRYNNRDRGKFSRRDYNKKHAYYYDERDSRSRSSSFFPTLIHYLRKALHIGNTTLFEVTRNGADIIKIPLTVLVIAFVFFFHIILILMLAGLFFGFRYKFSGSLFDETPLNTVMNTAANAVDGIKEMINKLRNS